MNKLALIALCCLPMQVFALKLKVGDILLQPLQCWSCTLIEAQENSIYSHMGMIISISPEVQVIEALGTVRTISLATFNARTQKDQKLSVRRFRNDKAVQFLSDHKNEFLRYYSKHFAGAEYDHDFLWENVDGSGNEKIYCSELVTKLLNGFLGINIPVKRMKFDKNRDGWFHYFRGPPPDGKWGNAPADFEKSEMFYEVGEI